MNDHERIQRLLPIIEAYAQGMSVETKDADGKWVPLATQGMMAAFNGYASNYRIKPEPREVFIEYDSAGNFERVHRGGIDNWIMCDSRNKVVKFREVIE